MPHQLISFTIEMSEMKLAGHIATTSYVTFYALAYPSMRLK